MEHDEHRKLGMNSAKSSGRSRHTRWNDERQLPQRIVPAALDASAAQPGDREAR